MFAYSKATGHKINETDVSPVKYIQETTQYLFVQVSSRICFKQTKIRFQNESLNEIIIHDYVVN